MRARRDLWVGGFVVVAIALDVLLVGAAVHHGRGIAVQPPVAVGVSATPSPTSHATTTSRQENGLSTFLLSDSGPKTAWRASAGCGHAPDLTVTADRGKAWKRLHPPVAHILRIAMTGPKAGWVVGADSACALSYVFTNDGGRTWAGASSPGQTWVVVGQGVRRPDGSVSTPCGAGATTSEVAPASGSIALAVCPSGSYATTNGGATWAPTGSLPDGGRVVSAALVPSGSGRGVALVGGATGCTGLLVVRTRDLGAKWHVTRCLSALHAPAAVSLADAGIGIAVGKGAWWTTRDGGKTWR